MLYLSGFCLVFILAFVLGRFLSVQGYSLAVLNRSLIFVWGHCFVFVLFLALSAFLSEAIDLFSLSFYPYLPYLFWFALTLVVLYLWGLSLGLLLSQKPHSQTHFFSLQRIQILGLVLFGLGSLGAMKVVSDYLTAPLPPSEMRVRRGPENSILQSTRVTCIPAALANILPQFGLQCTEQECAKTVNTTRFGTRESDLILGLGKWGLQGERVSVLPEQLSQLKHPVIVKIWKGFAKHALAVYGIDEQGNVLLIDPSVGPLRMSPAMYRNALVEGRGVLIKKL